MGKVYFNNSYSIIFFTLTRLTMKEDTGYGRIRKGMLND
jgi:hypothetical protein